MPKPPRQDYSAALKRLGMHGLSSKEVLPAGSSRAKQQVALLA